MDFEKMKEMAAKDLKQLRKLQTGSREERKKAADMEKALQMLSERELEVLKEVYIDRGKRFTGFEARLQEKFGVCRAGVHRLKHNALSHYCIGIVMIKAAGNRG